ncbi:serine/threonine-protein kinase [Nonomuraea insulae]|uniref:Serine/threonine-protein kinase n=1 Tax=Nonomuraea insulae TaxID=1616787 RepID=A0ABW1D4D8_9ACTN
MPHAEPLQPGDPEAIAAYRIVGRLGEGGQGTVYLGQDPDGRPVAVKVLRESVGGDRFAKEIAAARRVEPFCIAQVLDASLGARPYIVSEYVEGPSLQQAGRHHGADLQRLAVSTATALAAIHQAGIVHRDFKPANVLLGRDGPRVIDFGVARAADSAVTMTSSIVGTPAFMAPEQLAGAYVGPAADVFAWASVMVYAATGTSPFGNDSLPAVINRILNQEPYLGDLAEPLRSIVYTCLAKDPAARPRMQDVLLRLIGGRPQPLAQQPQTGPWNAPGGHTLPPRRQARRFPLIAGLSGGVAACLVAAAVIWNVSADRDPVSPALAADSSEQPSPSATTPVRRKKTVPPKKRRTPTPAVRTTRPTPTQARSTPTRTRPTTTPSKKPTTTRPTTTRPTPAKTKAKATASFSLVYVRVTGRSRINQDGVTCYSGDVGFGIALDASEMGAPFSYQWLVDGQVVESGSRRMPSYSRGDYFGSKKLITPELGSSHTVVFRLTSPVSRTKSASWTMC